MNIGENMFRSIPFSYNKHSDLIARLLLQHCPELDLNGIEKQLLISCKDDLALYIMYLRENHLVTDDMFMEYFTTFVLNFDLGIEHLVQPILTAEQEVRYDIDCEKFADTLVDEWWKKFQVRTEVKLIKPDIPPMVMGNMRMRNMFTPDEMDDLHFYVAMILIRNGERCFIDLMIGNLVAGTIMMRVSPNKTSFNQQDKLQLTQAIGFEAKRMTERSGPLIFLFADKNYYRAHMREWREPSHGQIL